MSKKILFASLFSVLIIGLMFLFWKIGSFSTFLSEPLPSAIPYKGTVTTTPSPKPIVSTVVLAGEINLDVPFTSQAPHRNWSDPYQDFCEEASVLMAMSYVEGEDISNPDVADAKMLAIKSFEEKRFGYHKDTNIAETAIIVKEFYKYSKVAVVKNPSIPDIKRALSEGKVVVIPAAGRELGNPYFTQPGPLYHMLVIKGYTKNGDFITNDPGTFRGANFIYSPEVLMNAIHDWNNGNVDEGAKVMMIVG